VNYSSQSLAFFGKFLIAPNRFRAHSQLKPVVPTAAFRFSVSGFFNLVPEVDEEFLYEFDD
jgi:hypothetical protein